jgi:hypothetical protein
LKPIILYRPSELESFEIEAIKASFPAYTSRSRIPPNSLVIGRYSVLPFYQEVFTDITFNNSKLINSVSEHNYVADLGNYYSDLENFTFQTWYSLDQVPKSEAPFILKGATNSLKNQFLTKMYAETWEDAVKVHVALQQDSLVGTQHIYIRRYEELYRLGTTLTGLPITKEFRYFVCHGQILTGGFYWDAFSEDLPYIPDISEVPLSWLNEVISIVSPNVPFFVIDVAQTADGKWKVVELNDGQMSGLSGNRAEDLYSNLTEVLC